MTFKEWYEQYWKFGSSTDMKRAERAWLAAKDLNPVNLQDLEYICDTAARNFATLEESYWAERALKYRERLHELVSDRPG